MIPTDDALWPLLDRYLAGECSAADAALVREWLTADPDGHELVLADVRRIRDVVKHRPEVRGVETAWRDARRALELGGSAPVTPEPVALPTRRVPTQRSTSRTVPLSRWRWLWYPMAGLAAAATLWFVSTTRSHAPARVMTYVTGNGQRAKISLPDGSTVMLNVASRLDVPADFGGGSRTLRLSGEALFSVTHRAGGPFMVSVSGTTARVLGTSFVARRYPSDTATTVAVRDGKVAVGPTVLGAQEAVLVGVHGTGPVHAVDPGVFGFASGVLTIDQVPLRDAVIELDRWYDADIRIHAPAVEGHLVRGTFTVGSLNDLASMLEYTFDVRVVRDGRVLTLYPR